MMTTQRQKPPAQWPFVVLFLIIAVTSVIIGVLYYNYQKRSLINEKQLELSAISYLKIRQITQWRLERLSNGRFIGENVLLVRKFSEFLKNPDNLKLREEIGQTLQSLTENFDYKNALLLGKDGNVKIAFPGSDTLIGNYLKPLLPGIIKKQKIVLTDIHKADLINFVHLDLVVPLIEHSSNDTLVLGLLTLRVDPEQVLYPLLQSWPSVSKTAETLLFRKEGDQIVYLNELRHISNSVLTLKRPVTEAKLPAAMALDGITSTIDGIDYRNVQVVAAMNKVPGTNWYMVAKMDRAEILSTLTFQLRLAVIILILIIITSGSFLGLIMRNQRMTFYRKKYEAELERLALVKHFEYILKFANDIIFLLDNDLNIVEANDRALEYYQYTREEFIGMNVERIRAPESLSELPGNLRSVKEHEYATFETIHIRKDGTTFPIEISSRLVTIEGSKYYQSIGRDITERKNVENTLKESEDRFRKIFEESPFSILMTGKDFTIIRANLSFCIFIGYQEEELRLLTFRNFTHPDYIENDEISLMKLIAGEIPVYRTEKRYIRKDGCILWGSTSVRIIRNEKDEVQFFLVMIEDITSRVKASYELDNSVSLLKATLESTEDGLLVVDSSGKIVQYNKKFADLWKIPEEVLAEGKDAEALGYVKSQLINPEYFLENVSALYSRVDEISFDLLEFVDGRFYERYSRPHVINSKSVGRVWSFRDITARKKAETDLIAAKEKAEESDRLKTAFLHNVSHEIRTPMNAIIGFSTLLNEPDTTEEERHQYIDIIFQSGNQLLSIINDIVDIANVESGQAKIHLTEFNLNAKLNGLKEQYIIHGKQKSVVINLVTDLPDNESTILTDATKLIQILSNLINNAIKFTKNGAIVFGYVYKNEFLEFFVRDTGIGISPEHQYKIFDRFFQVDSTISRQYSGTGLGLSICKGYVELLGGEIRVESEPGKGTKFTFTIPFCKT
jgi:two-component system, sensor histidine kinase and response regulator